MNHLIKIGFVICLTLALLACSLGGTDSGGGFSSSDYQFLNEYNARNLDGHTIRWESNTIPVYTGGISGAESVINSWAGPVNFNIPQRQPL